MYSKFIVFSFIATLCLGIIGCDDDDKVASVPSYESIEVPNNIYTGQKSKANIKFANVGAYVLHADNSYTLSKSGHVYDKGSWRVVDPNGNSPEFTFRAPSEPGRYSLNFSSRFSFDVDLPGGGIYGKSNTVSATVNVMMADAVDACWGDSRERLSEVLMVKDTLINSEACKIWNGKIAFCQHEQDELDSLGGNAERIYIFNADGGLCRVEETTKFDLNYKRSYKEFEDGSSGYVNDSIENKSKYPHLIGVGDLYYYELLNEPVLEGELKDEYPVNNWGKYSSDVEKANLINAFWSGGLTLYSQDWKLRNENGVDITKCIVEVYAEDDKFVIKRFFEKILKNKYQ
jgi:hypothetical protein